MIRDTSAQDAAIDPAPAQRRRRKLILGGVAAAALGVAAVSPALTRWSAADLSVDGSQLRYATVTRGRFVSDVAVQGQVVAAVSPTLYASTAGTVSTSVNAGDKVEQGPGAGDDRLSGTAQRVRARAVDAAVAAGRVRAAAHPDARRERRQPADRRPGARHAEGGGARARALSQRVPAGTRQPPGARSPRGPARRGSGALRARGAEREDAGREAVLRAAHQRTRRGAPARRGRQPRAPRGRARRSARRWTAWWAASPSSSAPRSRRTSRC